MIIDTLFKKGNMKEWIQELQDHINCDDFEEVQEHAICKIEVMSGYFKIC